MLDYSDRRGDWLGLYSGRRFYPLDLRLNDLCIEDIAHPLSLLCRFGGHSKYHYSVAQHSILVAANVPHQYRLQALLHDCGEGLLVDIPTPLKRLINKLGNDIYDQLESRVVEVIFAQYEVKTTPESDRIVKSADMACLQREILDLTNFEATYKIEEPPIPQRIRRRYPEDVKEEFLEKFREYYAESKMEVKV